MVSLHTPNPGTLARSGLLLALVLGILHAGARPVQALGDGLNLLSGGFNTGTANAVIWTAPGVGTAFGNDFPTPGAGENSTQIRIPKGTFSKLRVSLKDKNQTAGSVTVTVRLNGADTDVACTVDVVGNCKSAPGAIASATTNDRLAIRIDNDLTDGDGVLLTYTLVYD